MPSVHTPAHLEAWAACRQRPPRAHEHVQPAQDVVVAEHAAREHAGAAGGLGLEHLGGGACMQRGAVLSCGGRTWAEEHQPLGLGSAGLRRSATAEAAAAPGWPCTWRTFIQHSSSPQAHPRTHLVHVLQDSVDGLEGQVQPGGPGLQRALAVGVAHVRALGSLHEARACTMGGAPRQHAGATGAAPAGSPPHRTRCSRAKPPQWLHTAPRTACPLTPAGTGTLSRTRVGRLRFTMGRMPLSLGSRRMRDTPTSRDPSTCGRARGGAGCAAGSGLRRCARRATAHGSPRGSTQGHRCGAC